MGELVWNDCCGIFPIRIRSVVWRVAKGVAMKDPEIVQRMGVVETR
jgi:hypothetical protein